MHSFRLAIFVSWLVSLGSITPLLANNTPSEAGQMMQYTWAAFARDGSTIVAAGWNAAGAVQPKLQAWALARGELISTRVILGMNRFADRQNGRLCSPVLPPAPSQSERCSFPAPADLWALAKTHRLPEPFSWIGNFYLESNHVYFVRYFGTTANTTRYVSAAGRHVQIYPVERNKPIRTLAEQQAPPSFLCFAPDGGHVAISGNKNETLLVRTADGHLVQRLRGHARHCAFSNNSRHIVTSGGNRAVVWNTKNGTRTHSVTADSDITMSTFAGEGQPLVIVLTNGTVLIREHGGKTAVRYTPPSDTRLTHVAFAPGADTVAASARDGSVTIIELSRGRALARLSQTGPARFAAFDETGKRVVTIAADNHLRVWELGANAQPPVLRWTLNASHIGNHWDY